MKGALVACKEPSKLSDGKSVENPQGIFSDLEAALPILLSSAGRWELMWREDDGRNTLPFSSALATSSYRATSSALVSQV